ncbi:MAG: hypothetical protein HW388_1160 [Dehalococcoidia bacterium]|nr:hypothetical protein [Dehalococcoidia bacterium]
MGKVHLYALPSLAESLGIEGTSEETIPDEEVGGDTTVRGLLNRLSARYRRFGQVVFDVKAQRLTGRVVIFLNDHDLELVNGLESKLSDGDTLTLIYAIQGG